MNPKKQLIDNYATMLLDSGFTKSEAKKAARFMFEEAQKNAWIIPECRIANDIWCAGMGDYLLSIENKDPNKRSFLDSIRAEGATDEDIRNYRNMTPIERAMADQLDKTNRLASYLEFVESGMTPERAAREVYKYHPRYGDPSDTSDASGEDRPLPDDLKDRVSKYVLKMTKSNPSGFKSWLSRHSSMNALIRDAIRDGRL